MAMDKRCILALLCFCLLQLTDLALARSHDSAKPIKRIDTHCHYIPPFYAKLLKDNNVTAGGFTIPPWNATAHLAVMDRFNISLSIVSVSTPGAVLTEGYPVSESRKLARQLNEYAYNLTMQYPTKFRFFATLTLPDVEGSVAEAVYALDHLKAAGVIILASSLGEVLGSPLFEPLYAALNERNATVFVHPSQSPCRETEDFGANSTALPPFAVDFLLDTTRAAVNLVFRNVTRKYPNVNYLLAHSGGFLPFAAYRVIGYLRLQTNQTEESVLSQLEGFYVDTAISGSKYALPSTLSLLDTSHLTYGSDFPFVSPMGIVQNTASLFQYVETKLAPQALRQINYKNAAHLVRATLLESADR